MYETVMTTERLILRPREARDIEANLAMDMDPAVHRFIFGDAPPNAAQHRQRLHDQVATGWPHLGGLWVVERRDKPGFLGWCCLVPLEKSGMIEIGYRYVRTAWGQGIATEAAGKVLDYGFRSLGLGQIVAVAHPDNRASHKVLLKIGLSRDGTGFFYGQDLAFFRLRADAYLGRADPRRAAAP